MSNYQLTDEQLAAIELAKSGENLKIAAYAGAGKTCTLLAMSDAMPDRKGLYLAFNKKTADEAASRFPSNIECRTAHSIAYRAVGYTYRERLSGRLSGRKVANEVLKLNCGIWGLTLGATGEMVLATMRSFCASADFEITINHAPWSELQKISCNDMRQAIAYDVTAMARTLWTKTIMRNSKLPISHDFYLKKWAMTEPKLDFDFVMFDEAQDASPSMSGVVQSQQCQQIYVGDEFQSIYKFRGATNAMADITTANACSLSRSFRFGQDIADVANYILNGQLDAGVNIIGFDKIKSQVESVSHPNCIIFRTNAAMIERLIGLVDRGKPHVVGGCDKLIALLCGCNELMTKGATAHSELCLFSSWSELLEYAGSDDGSDLAPIVKMIDKYGVETLIKLLRRISKNTSDDATTILSTAHKAKGLEWPSVQLASDFIPTDDKRYCTQESNLLYVAATRAQRSLDLDYSRRAVGL